MDTMLRCNSGVAWRFLWKFSKRVLFIDDDVMFSTAQRKTLSELNVQIDQAESGKSGIELAYIYAHQAIVLFLGLPDMTDS